MLADSLDIGLFFSKARLVPYCAIWRFSLHPYLCDQAGQEKLKLPIIAGLLDLRLGRFASQDHTVWAMAATIGPAQHHGTIARMHGDQTTVPRQNRPQAPRRASQLPAVGS